MTARLESLVFCGRAYDLNGNRTNSMNGAAIYDAQDRMTAGIGMSFSYDLNGSLTNRQPTAYGLPPTAFSYDLFGQLMSVALPDNRVVSYDRDAFHRVVAKHIDGVKVKGWIYKDSLKPIAETDANGNVVSFFVYGTTALSPDYMIRDGITYRFIRDVQSNVRLVVDSATGAIAQRLDYDSFGNVLLDTNPGFQPFGFQSGLYDPDTALVQFGARWYDPATGRWLSKDPILLKGGLNLYVFCGNDPVNYCDPEGLCEEESVWKAAGRGFLEGLGTGAVGLIRGLHDIAEPFMLDPNDPYAPYIAATVMFGPEIQMGKAIGGRVFWSGGTTAREAAETFARGTGAQTLEMTRIGKLLDAITTEKTYPYVRPLWNKASQWFARGADGAVDVFQSSQGVRIESVWRTVEYPELIKAGNPINYHITP